MIKNSLSFSQPLNSMTYNEHLAQKLQGNQGSSMSAQQMMGMGQGSSQNNALDQSGFATELRSQKTVSALFGVSQAQASEAQNYVQNREQLSNQNMSFNPYNNAQKQSMQNMRQNTGLHTGMDTIQNPLSYTQQSHAQSSMQRAMDSLAPTNAHPLERFVESKNIQNLNAQNNNSASLVTSSANTSVFFGATLSEKGISVDANGNIHIPENNGQMSGVANNSFPINRNLQNNYQEEQNNQLLRNSVTMPLTNQTYAETTLQKQGQEQITGQNREQTINQASTEVQAEHTTRPLAGMLINNRRFFALDSRSLGILSRVAEKNTAKEETLMQSIQSADFTKQVGIALNKNAPIALHSTGLSGSSEIFPQLDQANTLSHGQNLHYHQQNNSNIQNTSLGINTESFRLGSLAKQYESGSQGSAAIGYDRHGGTSYGTYQISSRAGTFTEFLKFLDKNAPDWAEKLRDAGSANTGSRRGAVPNTWKALCAENPERMEKLEYDFIVKTHYQPVANYVEEKWNGDVSETLQEVIFSTAVQHGVNGAKNVFNQALNASRNSENLAQEDLIKNVYTSRATKFSSSTEEIQQAARNRMKNEQRVALASLS